jgi:hypothetical protein
MLDGLELVRRMAGLERRIDRLTAMGRPLHIGCHLTHSASQSLANSTVVALTWDTESADDDGMHDPSTPTIITAPLAGIYRIVGQVCFDANATGWRQLALRRNGAYVREIVLPAVSTAGVRTTLMLATEIGAAVGDQFELIAVQASGTTLNVLSSVQVGPYFSVVLST